MRALGWPEIAKSGFRGAVSLVLNPGRRLGLALLGARWWVGAGATSMFISQARAN